MEDNIIFGNDRKCIIIYYLFLISGITGYLSYGDKTCQIVTQNLSGDMAIVLQAFLFIGVMFTYPLQIYPNIQIVEHLFIKFRRWNVGRQRRSKIMRRVVETESLIDSQEEEIIQVKSLKVSEIFFCPNNIFFKQK